jgi:hypothetical protein
LGGDAAGLRRALVTGDIEEGGRLAEAAATIGAAVLGVVSRRYDVAVKTFVAGDGQSGWADRMAPLPDPAPGSAHGPVGGTGQVRL